MMQLTLKGVELQLVVAAYLKSKGFDASTQNIDVAVIQGRSGQGEGSRLEVTLTDMEPDPIPEEPLDYLPASSPDVPAFIQRIKD